MRKVKVGVVGCGGIANGKHMPSLKKCENVELVGFCDLVPERAEKALSDFGADGAKVYPTYRELVESAEIEVVHVCTPNSSHAEISIAALRAGKHVLCEKPMAHKIEDARAMVKAAKESGKKLSIGYQTRSTPEYQYARKLIKEGLLGNVYYCKAPAIRRRGVPTWGVFLDYEKQGGGPMIDIGTHSIDAMLYMIDNYDVHSVTGASFRKLADSCAKSNNARIWTSDEYQVEDSAFGFIRFRNGCVMHVETSWAINMAEVPYPLICGDKAGLDLHDGKVRVNGERFDALTLEEISPNNYSREHFGGETLSPVEYEARQWIKSIVDDTAPLVLPEQALVVSEIIDAIYRSAETGETVYF